MSFRTILTLLGAVLLAGCTEPAPDATGAAVSADYERGPHRGRMLRDGDFAIEVTIFETGVPPQFRLYAYRNDEPLPPASDLPRPLVGSDREQALLEAWREAHWSLRLALQEVTRCLGHLEVEPLYAEARRCDNLLNELYRSRAELLARQVRDLLMSHVPSAPRPGVAVSVPLPDPSYESTPVAGSYVTPVTVPDSVTSCVWIRGFQPLLLSRSPGVQRFCVSSWKMPMCSVSA